MKLRWLWKICPCLSCYQMRGGTICPPGYFSDWHIAYNTASKGKQRIYTGADLWLGVFKDHVATVPTLAGMSNRERRSFRTELRNEMKKRALS